MEVHHDGNNQVKDSKVAINKQRVGEEETVVTKLETLSKINRSLGGRRIQQRWPRRRRIRRSHGGGRFRGL